MSESLERRVKSLEREMGGDDEVVVFVTWSDEEASVERLAPGDELRVVTWGRDDSVSVETVRGGGV